MMYGVPGTTNSRVPTTLPGRPIAGYLASFRTADSISATTRPAVAGFS